MPKRNTSTPAASNSGRGYSKLGDIELGDIKMNLKNVIYFEQSDNYVFTWSWEGVTVYDMKLVKGRDGWFISFPSRKGNDGKYYSIAYIDFSEDEKKAIIESITSLPK